MFQAAYAEVATRMAATGATLIFANAFIKQLNRTFAAGIPPVAVEQIKATDPLVLRGVGHPASALGQKSPQTVQALRTVMLHK
jgi:hypothetical protein